MKKNDFMQRLSDELQKRNVADAADILQEYEAHFAMKMADGYIEEEIAARLGDPTALAAQFDDAEETPEKKGGSKPLVVAGLCFADVFAGLFFILLAAWGLVLAAAALGAAGAARLLLTGRTPETVPLRTPKGIVVEVEPIFCRLSGEGAECAIRKDGGDDVDVTTGLPVIAGVTLRPELAGEVRIHGGEGVGRVTKPGLDQPVGEAAINRVPRQMIREAVEAACRTADYDGGAEVTISVPEGEAIAQKTFNPQMGIVGGISILGTSGIVEPMSMQAMIDTMALELRQAAAQGHKRLILTPGNYGQDFLTRHGLDGLGVPVVKCANFIGDALDQAAAEGFESVLLVGHVGKLVKLAGGIMNTHSRYADCRTELFCAYAAVCGGGQALCEALLDSATTDACIALLDQAGLRAPVMARLLTAIDGHVRRRAAGAYPVGVLLFSNVYGVLGRTEGYEEVLHEWKKG